MNTKYCAYCRKDHPETAEFWYKNGGVLRKCKVQYGIITQREQALAKVYRDVNTHGKTCALVTAVLRKAGYTVFREVVYGRVRMDIYIQDPPAMIEVKTSPVKNPARVLNKYRSVQAAKTVFVSGEDPANLLIWLADLRAKE